MRGPGVVGDVGDEDRAQHRVGADATVEGVHHVGDAGLVEAGTRLDLPGRIVAAGLGIHAAVASLDGLRRGLGPAGAAPGLGRGQARRSGWLRNNVRSA